MRTARAFWWVIGKARGSPVAWAEASQTTTSASLWPHHLVPCWRREAGLCKPPASECWCGPEHTSAGSLFCSLLLNCFPHPLSLSCAQQVPRTPSTLTTFWSHIWNTYKNGMLSDDAVITATLKFPKGVIKPYGITANVDKHSWTDWGASPARTETKTSLLTFSWLTNSTIQKWPHGA